MNKIAAVFSDTRTMANRCLLLSKRNPDTFLTSIMSPVLLMALFALIFGGAIDVGGDVSYVNYIVPGILLQCIGQCASTTAISVSDDIKKGIIDRFCTMPIHRPSVLTGHVAEALIRNIFSLFLVMVVALLVGFRPSAQLHQWLLAMGLLLLYVIMISWMSVFFGILANGPEGAGAFSVIAMVLPYVSSGFVPVETMPTALRIFSKYQPMTPIIECVRALLNGQMPKQGDALLSVVWCVALLALFFALSMRAFNRKLRK